MAQLENAINRVPPKPRSKPDIRFSSPLDELHYKPPSVRLNKQTPARRLGGGPHPHQHPQYTSAQPWQASHRQSLGPNLLGPAPLRVLTPIHSKSTRI